MRTLNTDASGYIIDCSKNLSLTTQELDIFQKDIGLDNKEYHDFFNFHECNGKKNSKMIPLVPIKKSIENGIKSTDNSSIFNMPLETLLEHVRHNREKNYKELPYKNIINRLDGALLSSTTPITTIDKKRLDELLIIFLKLI